jgi:hypothetical protein
MKYLKIENNKGYFLKQNDWIEIDQIEKNDLIYLLDMAVENDFEMDIFEEVSLANKAHQIIYKHLYEKLSSFLSNKTRFKIEAENLYKDAFEKYQ